MLINDLPRVLFVSYTADWTGPTNSLLLLLTYLRNRYDVAVLLPGQGLFSEALTREQIPFFSLPDLTKRSIPAIFRLIRRERFDLVYGNSTHGSSRNALIAAKLAGVPFICHVRAMATGRPWLSSLFLNFADAVVTVSQACADSLRGRVFSHKLHVVYNGIEVADFDGWEATRSLVKAELNLAGEYPMLISVGHLKPVKGQHYAVQAVAQAIERAGPLDLLLVGSHNRDEEYVRRIKTLITTLGLAERVRLTGFRDDTLILLSLADIYIHTSLEEAHPRSVLEAMAVGLPVVAFAVDGVAETVVNGKTGYLAPPARISDMAEAILKLVANPSLRAQMGREGRHRVETCFSASITAEKVARIIDSQLRVPGGSAG